MDDIRHGALQFQRVTFHQKKALFRRLAVGQTPKALFITCADSRVEPALITNSQPGQLFVDRNPGNFIPPYHGENASESAGIEYALKVLKIPAIIICGHSDCGAMKGVLHPAKVKELHAVANWIKNGAAALRDINKMQLADDEHKLAALTERNVVRQLAHLKTYPVVKEALKAGKLMLAGWVYDIGKGVIQEYIEADDAFRPLNV
jgi:carbonic anhydrase